MFQEFQSLYESPGWWLEDCSQRNLSTRLRVTGDFSRPLEASVDAHRNCSLETREKTGCLEKRIRKRTSSTSISAEDARTMNGFFAIASGNAHCARSRPGRSRYWNWLRLQRSRRCGGGETIGSFEGRGGPAVGRGFAAEIGREAYAAS